MKNILCQSIPRGGLIKRGSVLVIGIPSACPHSTPQRSTPNTALTSTPTCKSMPVPVPTCKPMPVPVPMHTPTCSGESRGRGVQGPRSEAGRGAGCYGVHASPLTPSWATQSTCTPLVHDLSHSLARMVHTHGSHSQRPAFRRLDLAARWVHGAGSLAEAVSLLALSPTQHVLTTGARTHPLRDRLPCLPCPTGM